jgi:hypothetical protein
MRQAKKKPQLRANGEGADTTKENDANTVAAPVISFEGWRPREGARFVYSRPWLRNGYHLEELLEYGRQLPVETEDVRRETCDRPASTIDDSDLRVVMSTSLALADWQVFFLALTARNARTATERRQRARQLRELVLARPATPRRPEPRPALHLVKSRFR